MAQKAPEGLGGKGKSLWRGIAGPNKWELRADELRVLEDACREADLIAILDAGMVDAPLFTTGSQGQDVINPLISELRQHRMTLRALLAQLKLPDVDADASVVAGERSSKARAAANSRWSKRGA
jgi:hypothetical protein